MASKQTVRKTEVEAEYSRILRIIDSLNKHAHYKADFIISVIEQKTRNLSNKSEFQKSEQQI